MHTPPPDDIAEFADALTAGAFSIDAEMLRKSTLEQLDSDSLFRLRDELQMLLMSSILLAARHAVKDPSLNDTLQQGMYQAFARQRQAPAHDVRTTTALLYARSEQYRGALFDGLSGRTSFSDCILEVLPLTALHARVDSVAACGPGLLVPVGQVIKYLFSATVRACRDAGLSA